MFRLVGVPHRFFGETHIIVSVWREGSVWKAEYSILSKRPAEHLEQCVIDFDVNGYPTELPPVDAPFMKGEALRQAQNDLILELEKRATEAGREDLAYMPLDLEPEAITPVTLWARSAYPQKFVDMYNGTKSQDLKRYLQIVMSMARFKSA
ncbi:hypothetical protein N8A90_13280 [Variovorax sp. N23]|nr:hypothetical protein [Variovorax sp. N23]